MLISLKVSKPQLLHIIFLNKNNHKTKVGVSEVGSSEWCWLAVMGVAVVGGCDSRWRHRLLLESVPGLTPPPKKEKKVI